MPNPHDHLIATAARTILGPLGFRRKGRSRIWTADRGWWFNVVEFQPSARAKGRFLNVNAHCLWVEDDYISYQYGGRVEAFSEFESGDQFEQEATRLAQAAAKAARRLDETFSSIEAAAAALMAKEKALPEQARGSWPAFHAGVAMGLSGNTAEAAALFHSIQDERVRPAVARVDKLLATPDRFKGAVDSLIGAHREALGFAAAQQLALSGYQS